MWRTSLAIVSIASAVVMGVASAVPRGAAATTAQRSITVTADGSVTVPPDVAFVTVGVQQTALDAAKAQQEANAVTTAAIAGIKALGIPDKDIQTVNISLNPQYDDRGALTGFTAADTLSITVEHPKQAGAVIDAGVAAGANQGIGVSFGLLSADQARADALRAAVTAAEHKAAGVAAQLGVSLQGAKIQVVENSAVPTPVQPQFGAIAAPSRAANVPTPVQTGTLTVQDSVTVTYTL